MQSVLLSVGVFAIGFWIRSSGFRLAFPESWLKPRSVSHFFCEICCKKFENYQKNVFVTPNQRTKRKTRHFFSVFHSPLNQNLSLKTKVRYCNTRLQIAFEGILSICYVFLFVANKLDHWYNSSSYTAEASST